MIKKLNVAEETNKPTFTAYQTSNIIREAETRIISLKKELSEVTPSMKEYKAAYEKLKLQYDTVVEKLQQDEQLLEYMSRIQNRISGNKSVRVVRGESHNDMKDREKRKLSVGGKRNIQFPWTSYAIEILRGEGRFTTLEDLWTLVDLKYDTVAKIERDKLGFGKIKWGALHNCWIANAESTRAGRTRTKGGDTERLVMIGDRIGLRSWTDEDFKPLPQYKSLKVAEEV